MDSVSGIMSLNSPGGSTVVRGVTRQFSNACKFRISYSYALQLSIVRLQWETNSSAVAERPRDALCLSVSFSNTVAVGLYVERNRLVRPIDYFCFRFTVAYI